MDSPACCCPAGASAALRLPTAKEAGQETASTRRTARKIALHLLHTRLGRVQRLLLNDNCLRHEVIPCPTDKNLSQASSALFRFEPQGPLRCDRFRPTRFGIRR